MKSEVKFKRIDADLLIPGKGDPIEHGILVYSGSSIAYVGTEDGLPSEFEVLSPFKVPVLMPGMWDSHVHFFGADKYSVDTFAETESAIAGMRCVRDAVATLNAGFTSVRELAGYGVQLAQIIKEGWIPGPNIYSSVSILSQTSGHGDGRSMSLECMWDKINHGLPCYLCDGPSECTKAVRVQIRRGASVIKIAASGGVASTGDDISTPQFDEDELKAIVKEATRNKLIVAAHCHAKIAVKMALEAGCKTIEHGTFLDEELIKLMVEKDAILVATRGVVEWALSNRNSWSPEQYQQLLNIRKHHAKSYQQAVKAGVRCLIGTDLGASVLDSGWNHGNNGREFKYAVEAGMTPLQAIEAGTARGPCSLGPKAPKSGQLCSGYDADFIALSSNPLKDITILGEPENVLHVWKGGKMYKKDGKPIDLLNTTKSGAV